MILNSNSPYSPLLTECHETLSDAHINFQMFSTLPTGTWINKAPDCKYFKPVAGTNSSYFGMQYLSSFIERYDIKEFNSDFQIFTNKISNAVYEIFDYGKEESDLNLKTIQFRALQEINTSLNSAMGDKTVGILGLLQTHEKDSILPGLVQAINNLKNKIEEKALDSQKWVTLDNKNSALEDFTKSQFLGTSEKLNYYPELKFTDQEWEGEIQKSENFIIESPDVFKYSTYTSSLVCEQAKIRAMGEELWHEIIEIDGTKLYLGSMPLMGGVMGFGFNDLTTLYRRGVRAVGSLNEKFETDSAGYLISPITSKDWKAAGIKQLQIPTPDRKPVPPKKLVRMAAFINWNIENKWDVLIHCKQGKTRSMKAVIAYLIIYQGFTADAAYEYVHKKRPQAHFENHRMAEIYQLEREWLSSKAILTDKF